MPSIQVRAKKLSSMESQFHLKATPVAYGSERVKPIDLCRNIDHNKEVVQTHVGLPTPLCFSLGVFLSLFFFFFFFLWSVLCVIWVGIPSEIIITYGTLSLN